MFQSDRNTTLSFVISHMNVDCGDGKWAIICPFMYFPNPNSKSYYFDSCLYSILKCYGKSIFFSYLSYQSFLQDIKFYYTLYNIINCEECRCWFYMISSILMLYCDFWTWRTIWSEAICMKISTLNHFCLVF